MDLGFPTRAVREGAVEILVPDVPRLGGPGVRSALPFYNPAMAVSRDLCALLADRLLPANAKVLDGLAATGALGIRIAAESSRPLAVTLNDKNPSAVALISANLERNRVAGARALHGDVRVVLASDRFDAVEVDPFGSPVPFLDAAVRSARRGTYLGVSATDTAVLCGSRPAAAWRRYLARVVHTDAYAEVGVRVLLGYVARIAARSDRGVEPILGYAAEHFLRVHVRMSEGASRADAALAHLGWCRVDPATGRHEVVEEGPGEGGIGPVWMGPLLDPEVVPRLTPGAHTGHAAARILDLLRGEVGLPPFYLENNALARRLGRSPPPLSGVLGALRDRGRRAAPTHFRANAFKTDASWDEVLEAVRRPAH